MSECAKPAPTRERIFVTGGTGYIGGRLVPRLLDAGHLVRCLARSARKLEGRAWSGRAGVEIVEGDAADSARLTELLRGCSTAYYLVHSMLAAGAAYANQDRVLARGFARAAEQAGVTRIIYLGGLGESGPDLSEHLRSRREVEAALRSTSVPVTVFRAAMIIGSGSASFEILRYLVERLPIMITPRWVATRCQPIGVDNVIHYLVACLACKETIGETLDIGGADVLTYRDIMDLAAAALGLPRRWILAVPVLTPRLSSLWIHLVTPLDREIARPLAEGLRNAVVCRDDRAALLLPQRLLGIDEAIRRAVADERHADVPTAWSDAGSVPGDPGWSGGAVFEDRRRVAVRAGTDAVYAAVCRIGGAHGYHGANRLWRLRGALDRLVGGPGLRRGRRNRDHASYGDAIDFWRVTDVAPGRRLGLRAEMILPGQAELVFELHPDTGAEGGCVLEQTARFKPRGLIGILYWYAVLPFHRFVFAGLLDGLRREAEEQGTWVSPAAGSRPVPGTRGH